MKYLIASDIHGSAYFCRELLRAFKEEKADKLILLGDILYHGPRNDLPKEYNPKEVIELLNNIKEKILCVRGNCDTEVDQMVLKFPILADYAVLCENGQLIYLTHGHKEIPNLGENDIVIQGHTHIPTYESPLNPGSVSIPKEGSHHGYMTLENSEFLWKDFTGEIKNTFKLY